jgi:four helix bundle protein
MFLSRLDEADVEATETQVWLDFAFDCGYLSEVNRDELSAAYDELDKALGRILTSPEKFLGDIKR